MRNHIENNDPETLNINTEKEKLSPLDIEKINQLEYQNRRLNKLYNISLIDRKILQEALEGTL
jgi:hypothetical protein